jgi:hypothetical protein
MNSVRTERDGAATAETLKRLQSAMQEEQDSLTLEILARNLHRDYLKDTTGIAGQWVDLDEEGRKLWRAMSKRAIRKIEELRLQSEVPGNLVSSG